MTTDDKKWTLRSIMLQEEYARKRSLIIVYLYGFVSGAIVASVVSVLVRIGG